MKIQELEQRTGLDRATIRYYEREGLVTPTRNPENGYRDYSGEDEALLMKVKLLRQLEFPLDQIKALRAGTLDFRQAMEAQIHILEGRARGLKRAGEVCREIREAGSDFGSLNALHYLSALQETQSEEPFREEQELEFHPLRRYFARMLDWALVSAFLNWIFYCVIRVRPDQQIYSYLLTVAAVVAMIPLEAVFVYLFGTTPGKWVYGIRVESVNGGKPNWEEALWRSRLAMHFGLGFQIPIWSYIRLYLGYTGAKEGKRLEWEEDTELHYKPFGPIQYVRVGLAYLLVILCLIGIVMDKQFLPRHQDSRLTVAQFADNYNGYAEARRDYVVTISGLPFMEEDGSWYAVILHTDMTPWSGPEFVCDEQGVIQSISLTNRLDNDSLIPYNGIWRKLITAAIGSDPGMNALNMMRLESEHPFDFKIQIPIQRGETEGEFAVGNTTFRWDYAPATKTLTLKIEFP